MNQTEIARVFRRVYNGDRNFMTPDILRFGIRGHFIYELSSGAGIDGGTLYGLPVLELDGQHRPASAMKRPDLSTCYLSRALAHLAIEELGREPELTQEEREESWDLEPHEIPNHGRSNRS